MTNGTKPMPRVVDQVAPGQRVVVIGAGPGGLTAAYALAKAGISVTVLQADNALRGLGLVNALLIVMSYVKARLRPSKVEENLEQWVTNRFGWRLYTIFFKTYTEKVWGIPCTEIRAEWAAQRIQGLSLVKAVLSAASLQKRSETIKTLINEFRYPRLGPGQMWEACRDRVVALGHPGLMP